MSEYTQERNVVKSARRLALQIVQFVERECPEEDFTATVVKQEALSLAFHLVNGTNGLQDFVAGFQLRQFPRPGIES